MLIKEKWSSAHQPILFTSGLHTIQRAEAINANVKNKLTKNTQLKELFTLILGIEKKMKLMQVKYAHKTSQALHHPLLLQLRDTYSVYAFDQMFYQYLNSHDMTVSVKRQEIIY